MSTAIKSRKLPEIKVLTALRGVKSTELTNQIVAGVTLAALMIPLNIGYAQVAGLPPVVGLYGAILPMILFGLFSTSRNLIAGPDAPIAALIGSVLLIICPASDPKYVELAYGLAIVSALFFFAFWLFRLGFLANFLSKAVLVGFISGLGIEVLTSQVQKIMGISVEADHWLVEVWDMIKSIPEANIYCLVIGIGAILLIRGMKRYTPRIPGALVALVLATLAVEAFNLDQLGVSVLGQIPQGLPSFHLPQIGLTDYVSLIPGALAVVGITMAEGLLVARKYASKYDDKIEPDMELFAFGAANLATGLTGGLVVGSSASRTAAMDNAGMRSQIPSIVGAIVVAIVLMFLTGLLALVPNAVLAGIVANAVLALIEVGELRLLYWQRRSEFWIAAVCLATVLALGPLPAVIIAFLLSAIDVVRRAARPRVGVLRTLPDGQGYYASHDLENIAPARGLILFRFGAELFFANANFFQECVKRIVEKAGAPVRWLVLDAEAISDIDTTGAEALEAVIEYLKGRGITLALARAEPPIPHLLERYRLTEKFGPGRLFATNRAAVQAFLQETGEISPIDTTKDQADAESNDSDQIE
jgi:high affinity sulfate transporter 1